MFSLVVRWSSLLLLLVSSSNTERTDNMYCSLHINHTLCLYSPTLSKSNSCGRVFSSSLVSEEKRLIVEIHNSKRAFVALGKERRGVNGPQPSAANMMQLTWDEELSSLAQAWANTCPDDHDCPDCRRLPRFRVGQNLYVFGHFSGNWQRAIDGWYDEVVDFPSSFIDPFFIPRGLLVGHYTQMVWAQVTRIGCGKLLSQPEGSRFGRQVFVCNYGLAGNLIGSQMYKKGKACSACPRGTSCSSTWPGLCAGTPSQPVTVRPPDFVDFNHFEKLNLTIAKSSLPEVITLDEQHVSAPTPSRPDACVYECKKSGGCSVQLQLYSKTDNFSGSVMGSCFSAKFGGSCSGTPEKCHKCNSICSTKTMRNRIITFNVDEQDSHGSESVSEMERPTDAFDPDDHCAYRCERHGGCSVRVVTSKLINGSVLGSCFSELFGGSCSGTPIHCNVCNQVCKGKEGMELKQPLTNLL